MTFIIFCYCLSALSLVWPMYRYESTYNDGWPQHLAAGTIAVFLSAFWPAWMFMLLRKAFLTALIGGADE